MSPELAREIIEQESGKHFDPEVATAFCACYHDLLAVMHGINVCAVPRDGSSQHQDSRQQVPASFEATETVDSTDRQPESALAS